MEVPAYLRWRCIAALAFLQPGIDPIFLVLLSSHSGLAPEDHGWVVGVTQAAMAIGAILAWRSAARHNRRLTLAAAIGSLAASVATATLHDLTAILIMRFLFGLGCGFLFTHAMASAAEKAATHAFGTMFVLQLLLATAVSALLPYVSQSAGSGVAMLSLALGPVLICALLPKDSALGLHPAERENEGPAPSTGASTAIVALGLFICAIMMVWSYVGALASAAGLSEQAIGWGISLGSLSGAIPAVLLAHFRARSPILVGAAWSALATLSPLLAPASIDAAQFAGIMLLFNIGSTYALVRWSALAVDQDRSAHNRSAVAATHSIAMIAGPLSGAAAMRSGGFAALEGLATLALAGAVTALALVARAAQTEKSATLLTET